MDPAAGDLHSMRDKAVPHGSTLSEHNLCVFSLGGFYLSVCIVDSCHKVREF